MPNAVELIKLIKRTAVDAVNAAKPTEVCFGKVIGVSPLKITVEQKMTLTAAQLVLTRNVTKYKTQISREETPEEKIKIIVHNGLVVGDEVVLLRQQGGQKYIVVDRIK